MNIRILVAVARGRPVVATRIYDGNISDAKRYLRGYDLDNESIQYCIVEADVPDWKEPAVPVVKGEAKEVTL